MDEEHAKDRSVARRAFIATSVAVLVIGGAYVLSLITQVLLFIFGGILLALFLRGAAQFITRHTGLWPRVSLALVVIVLLGLFAGVLFFAGPQLASQADTLSHTLPQSIDTIRKELAAHAWTRSLVRAIPSPTEISPAPRNMLAGLPGFFSATTEAFALVLLSIFVGIYVAANPRAYLDGLMHLVPPPARDRANQIVRRIHTALGWWLVGRIITMTLMGVFTMLGLWLLDMPLALTLGVISGLFQFVPYLGAFAAAVPAVLIGLIQSPSKALEVAALYLVVHSVEGYLVTPIIQQRAIALPPAALISVQLIMAALFGITGVIFATPAAVLIIVLVQTLYLHDVLDDQVPVLGQR